MDVLRKNTPLPPPPKSMKKAGHTEILRDVIANITGARNGGQVSYETATSPPATGFGQDVHEMSTSSSTADAGPRPGAGYLLELELARERIRIRKLEEAQNAWKQEKKKLPEKVIAQCSAFADVDSQLPPEVVEPPARPTTSPEKYVDLRDRNLELEAEVEVKVMEIPPPTPPTDTSNHAGAQQLLDRLLPILGHVGQTLQSLIASSSKSHNKFLVLLLVIFIFSMTIIIMVYWIISTKLIWFLGMTMAMAILYAVTVSWNVKVRAEVERERVGVERKGSGLSGRGLRLRGGRLRLEGNICC